MADHKDVKQLEQKYIRKAEGEGSCLLASLRMPIGRDTCILLQPCQVLGNFTHVFVCAVTNKSRRGKAGETAAAVIVLIVPLVLVCGLFIALAPQNHILKTSYILKDNHGYVEIPLQATEVTANLLQTVESGQNEERP